MAPEQIRRGYVSSAVDMFGLGSVLVFAASGRPPFGEGQLETVMYRILNDAPRLDRVPPELHAVIDRLLNKVPGQRPTARELYETLTGSSEDPSTEVTPELGRTWALPANQMVTVVAAPAPETASGSTSTRKRGPSWWPEGVLAIVAVTAVAAAAIGFALTRHTPGSSTAGNATASSTSVTCRSALPRL
jgi:serine/threonine protein kinase